MTTETLTDCPLTEPHTPGRVRSHATGCRCPETMTVHDYRLAQERTRKRRKKDGTYDPDILVTAKPARAHLRRLIRNGHRPTRIAEATGVSFNGIYRIRHRHVSVIRKSTAEAILGFKGDIAATVWANDVPALATMRRLRALAAVGQSTGAVARLAPVPEGRDPGVFWKTRAGRLEKIRAGNASGVSAQLDADTAAAYDQLWNQPPVTTTHQHRGNVTRLLRLAQREGWLPPMYWDDDRMGDPSYTPRIPYDARHDNPQENTHG